MANRKKTARSQHKSGISPIKKDRVGVWRYVVSFSLGAAIAATAAFVFLNNKTITNYESSPTNFTDTQTKNSNIVYLEAGKRTVGQLLALPDEELEKGLSRLTEWRNIKSGAELTG